jgi:hypothetical protein
MKALQLVVRRRTAAIHHLMIAARRLRDVVVAVLTDDRPAYAWRQGPDHLYQATRSAFGRPRRWRVAR